MRAGDLVFISGQVPKDENNNMISGTIEVETAATLKTIERVIADEGGVLVRQEVADGRGFHGALLVIPAHPPPSKPGKWVKFYYATQADIAPPTFVFFCSDPVQIHFSYRRYLENQIREVFGFVGTPIRMSFRGRDEGR